MTNGGDKTLSGDVGHVNAGGHVAGKTENNQGRGHHVPAAHADESADDADREPDQSQQEKGSLNSRDSEIEHSLLLLLVTVLDLADLQTHQIREPFS